MFFSLNQVHNLPHWGYLAHVRIWPENLSCQHSRANSDYRAPVYVILVRISHPHPLKLSISDQHIYIFGLGALKLVPSIPFTDLNSFRERFLEWGVLYIKTDVKKRGLASADRNNKATLLLTAPYSMTKSYAKGLSPRMVKLQDVS